MAVEISDELMAPFAEFVAARLGLHFPRERWPDLKRGVSGAARALGFANGGVCIVSLMSDPVADVELGILASHLTIGETYFFREPRQFKVLAEHILPALIRVRRNGERRLRLWSAACCSGEEAYSIAIVLSELLPDRADWDISLLATDINPVFLQKAAAGVYGSWSFRDSAPGMREKYFRPVGQEHFELRREIREMVRFSPLNLAEDAYASVVGGAHGLDVIFCRNVLMYFTAAQAQKVIQKLFRSQVEGGWLVVGPSELLHVSSGPYAGMNVCGVPLHQKKSVEKPVERAISQPLAEAPRWVSAAVERSADRAVLRPRRLAVLEVETKAAEPPLELPAVRRQVISLAKEGRLDEALQVCDAWIRTDRTDAAAHYLRATVLREQQALNLASHSLRTVLYLRPEFVMAHLALGNIAQRRGRTSEAHRHLKNVLRLLREMAPGEVLAESEGVTAGELLEALGSHCEVRNEG